MAIVLKSPVFLNEKGKRKNNEDSIYPPAGTGTAQQRLFLVCDGVGGASKGEVASMMVCEAISTYFKEYTTTHVDEAYIIKAVRYAEGRLARHAAVQPECAGMSTTLTLLWLDDQYNRAFVAWVGDSRVYQVRQGKVEFMTTDHSLVFELVKRGELRPEDASSHPQRNVILRAISGSGKPETVDIVEITDLQIGDYFMLCSDGILESIDEYILEELLPNTDANLETAQAHIYQMCDHLSNDNFSMYLLNIADITPSTASPIAKKEVVVQEQSTKTTEIPVSSKVQDKTFSLPYNESTPSSRAINTNRWIAVAGTACLLLLLGLGIYKMRQGNKTERYINLLAKADSIRQTNDTTQAINLYQEAHSLFPNKKDAMLRIKEIRAEERGRFTEDSLRQVIETILVDSVLLKEVNITSNQMEEARKNLDVALINNLQELLDSIKNRRQQGDSISARELIQQHSQPAEDTQKDHH